MRQPSGSRRRPEVARLFPELLRQGLPGLRPGTAARAAGAQSHAARESRAAEGSAEDVDPAAVEERKRTRALSPGRTRKYTRKVKADRAKVRQKFLHPGTA